MPRIIPANPAAAPTIVKAGSPKTSYKAAAIAAMEAGLKGPVATPAANGLDSLPVKNASALSQGDLAAVKTTEAVASERSDTSRDSKSPSEPEVTEKAPDLALSSQHAILARKEKALRQNIQRLNAERDAFKAEREAAEKAKVVDTSKFISKDQLLADPFSVLNSLGLSYEQLTNQALNQPSVEEQRLKKLEMDIESKFKTLQDEQDKTRKSYEDSQKQQYDQAVNQIRTEVKQLVNSDESFEMIKATNNINEVVKLIESTFNEGLGEDYPAGTVLDISTAAQMIEDELLERSLKLARLKKIQDRLKPEAPAPKKADEVSILEASKGMKTLTNSVSATRSISARERAIARFKGEQF